MTATDPSLPNFGDADLPAGATHAEIAANRFTEATLERHKREGLELAVRARWVALAVIAVLLPMLNFSFEMIYYELLLAALALIGWAQRRIGRVGRSGNELVLLFVELSLTTVVLALPNPLDQSGWPAAMTYRFGAFSYFFVILAAGTLAYSWRTIMAIGNWTAAMWLIALGLVWWFGKTDPALTEAAQTAFGQDQKMAQMLDPNNIDFGLRVQEIILFLIVAFTLALSVRRFNRLLLDNAVLERERTNLSRYFSPNVVEELSHNDDPLKEIRSHDVAVLFVDIVGFTAYAATRLPQQLIETLRAFHARMETEVFRHQGTLDKYLGDGLMATFGTPMPGERDASNALECAKRMMEAVDRWNGERAAQGEPPIQVSFGLHFGPVVLGDVGANRLEFAVVGNTVNIASRLEAMSRELSVQLVMSEAMHARIQVESGVSAPMLAGLRQLEDQPIRGIDGRAPLWVSD
ncbi:adenylate/guanylate cyclase domain-containing protein [Sedimentitalea todarodis]|uniref:Adenylate/guanylate cyclase domain-containing protein n=1 Tax=Sedimentitalea todarodis TaxID=1631240 RepID=A0ABU3VGL2_9RHOB|nr:adenylate/guanylate cyclase domain-containing protein [Sedimentitalea todarodis]MDU9005125.1 adenylate/guanylate cyclase domain-containing protein [Sedimentitalea todarodis]